MLHDLLLMLRRRRRADVPLLLALQVLGRAIVTISPVCARFPLGTSPPRFLLLALQLKLLVGEFWQAQDHEVVLFDKSLARLRITKPLLADESPFHGFVVVCRLGFALEEGRGALKKMVNLLGDGGDPVQLDPAVEIVVHEDQNGLLILVNLLLVELVFLRVLANDGVGALYEGKTVTSGVENEIIPELMTLSIC